ncbi:MAG: NRDE family protein [Pseudohongiellaceae bacterium]
MCLIVCAFQPAASFPLVLAANRDEFYTRPTRPAKFWDEAPETAHILAGKDLLQGGTWLGITRDGRFAAVTNYRDPVLTEARERSRGALVRDYLQGALSPRDYVRGLRQTLPDFAGFNLLVGDRSTLYYCHNIPGQGADAQRPETVNGAGSGRELSPGIYAISNGLLDAPWPKVVKGRENLRRYLENSGGPVTDGLLKLMTDRDAATDAELPQTGVGLELERVLSAVFIHNPPRGYGTRSSTALIMDNAGLVRLSEQNYDATGQATDRNHFEFKLTSWNHEVRDERSRRSTPAL